MSFEIALRLTEILLALAVIQQSAEHWHLAVEDSPLFVIRIACCIALLFGWYTPLALFALLLIGIVLLHRYDGPYNGGSDRMTLLVMICLAVAHAAPTQQYKDLALGYLSIQLILSYMVSGWVKLRNPDWRDGHALSNVFRFSAYPVSEGLRLYAHRGQAMFFASWGVILFELAFPLVLLNQWLLAGGLFIAASFHLANACLFGLNRFFWIWLAAYPSLIWFQDRISG